ncbi:hypothetical protein L209DRAFT_747134 [Thermothelomyces heterothallicus CBS 203.75]
MGISPAVLPSSSSRFPGALVFGGGGFAEAAFVGGARGFVAMGFRGNFEDGGWVAGANWGCPGALRPGGPPGGIAE